MELYVTAQGHRWKVEDPGQHYLATQRAGQEQKTTDNTDHESRGREKHDEPRSAWLKYDQHKRQNRWRGKGTTSASVTASNRFCQRLIPRMPSTIRNRARVQPEVSGRSDPELRLAVVELSLSLSRGPPTERRPTATASNLA